MVKALLLNLFVVSAAFAIPEDKAAASAKTRNPILMTNQMMLVFMERMKNGDYGEAREIAQEMTYGHQKYQDTAKLVHKSFHSIMEKELYEMKLEQKGENKKVKWVQQPLSDGYYLLAMVDFQQGKHESALKNLQEAISWNPVRSAFYNERGYMLLRKNSGPDLIMAQIAYEKALELADNAEDFAAALRGLAFVLVERGQLARALACLKLSKQFDETSLDAEEEMLFIRRADPDLFVSMSDSDALELLKSTGIQVTYSPEHLKVLLKLARKFKRENSSQKARAFLEKANLLFPDNAEVKRMLKNTR
jgi:tetratricopeptide (TPR) repeat protein